MDLEAQIDNLHSQVEVSSRHFLNLTSIDCDLMCQ